MTRPLLLLVPATLLLLALPASACGGEGAGPDEGEYRYCHDYTLRAGDESNGVHANEAGQFLVAAEAAGWYVESDVAYLEGDTRGWSIWFYSETNGAAGMQRADEVCNNTPEGQDSDATIC